MTRRGNILALMVLGVLGLASWPATALTQAQVTERAQKFLKDAGRDVPAVEPTVSRLEGDYEPGCWRVSFDPLLWVEVSDSSSKILGFLDGLDRKMEPADVPMSRDEARRLAEAYMAAAGGLPEGAVFHNVQPKSAPGTHGLSPSEHPAGWSVRWKRYIGGYEVSPDALVVALDAKTGRLWSFRNGFLTPPPPSMKPGLSRQQAEAAARAQEPRVGESPAQEAYLYVRGRGHGPWQKTFQRDSVLAWQVNWPGVFVSVDATTGKVLEVGQPRGAVTHYSPGGLAQPRGPVTYLPRGVMPRAALPPPAIGAPAGHVSTATQERPDKTSPSFWIMGLLGVLLVGVGGSYLIRLKLRRHK